MRHLPRGPIEAVIAKGIRPERVADAVVRAVRADRALTTVSLSASLLSGWYRRFPNSYRRAMAVAGRLSRRVAAP